MVELRDPYTREKLDGREVKAGDKVLVIDSNPHTGDELTLFALITEVDETDVEHRRLGLVCKPFDPDTDL